MLLKVLLLCSSTEVLQHIEDVEYSTTVFTVTSTDWSVSHSLSNKKRCTRLNPYFLVIRMGRKKEKGLKTFNLYSWDKNCEPWEGGKQLCRHNTECITFIIQSNVHTRLHRHTCMHTYAYKQYKKQKLIRTNKACLNAPWHISVHIHICANTHTHRGGINLFRLVVCFNYYNQSLFPPSVIASTSVAVAVKNKLKQFHLWAEKQTPSPLSLSLHSLPLSLWLCSVKAFNQALVYFLFVYNVIVRT